MGAGPLSLIIIGIVALLLFGPKKLPELGKAMGTTLREFKNATKGLADDDDEEVKKVDTQKIEEK
ncbi:twin-arginine translocase TatA/TatE family subunit [Psychrobacillus sp.]|uniref:twin-arginine translocase TatA/TatE family subunit n=1 Tax=Psychrobacillus sp. TaxID=1871623 RepID=UPI0028BDBDF4|nr:twin-arginine translocase TatA/TatE family subunit [Psychrobacillus sp.]